jgi:hypothetical protein
MKKAKGAKIVFLFLDFHLFFAFSKRQSLVVKPQQLMSRLSLVTPVIAGHNFLLLPSSTRQLNLLSPCSPQL